MSEPHSCVAPPASIWAARGLTPPLLDQPPRTIAILNITRGSSIPREIAWTCEVLLHRSGHTGECPLSNQHYNRVRLRFSLGARSGDRGTAGLTSCESARAAIASCPRFLDSHMLRRSVAADKISGSVSRHRKQHCREYDENHNDQRDEDKFHGSIS